MKVKCLVILLALCMMKCSEREPRFEIISPANSILASFDSRDVEAVVDTASWMIKINEDKFKELSEIREGLIGGSLRISLIDGRNVSLTIRDMSEQAKVSCPFIVADRNTGIWLPYRLLVIDQFDKSECREVSNKVGEILEVLKVRVRRQNNY
jgi:hypothetical protein